FINPDDGTVYGSEMMLAKYVADCLGVKLKIETMDFNAVLTAVDTGKVDMAFSGFGWKADRAEAFELSVGYIGDDSVTYHTLIVPAADADNYKTLADFVGKHIVAQAGSLQQMYVEDQIVALEEN
ncbi:MAG: transporter substrate-binding domain-containing protein, partial [Erysipelotrichaceae bacterium]|nr:transporter substrate-binding domain-containing protein [Erysipelotrichaceae bacterium]